VAAVALRLVPGQTRSTLCFRGSPGEGGKQPFAIRGLYIEKFIDRPRPFEIQVLATVTANLYSPRGGRDMLDTRRRTRS